MSDNDYRKGSVSKSVRPNSNPLDKFTLMTPSASPPVQQPSRRPSLGPPPSKKYRTSNTPTLSSVGTRGVSVASRSSSSVPSTLSLDAPLDPGDELDAARRASSNKVWNVWSQLAAKYARRLDEDDIVDLRKEKIIMDNGVLRASSSMYEIGCFAEQHERDERDKPLELADDEPDEIDAFADIPDNMSRTDTDGEDDGLELMQQSQRLPPVRALDPADAADLAEFLEAEKTRKETYGDPDEHSIEDFGDGDSDGRYTRPSSRSGTEIGPEEDDENEVGVGKDSKYRLQEYYAPLNDDYETEDFLDSPAGSPPISKPSGSPELDILGIDHTYSDNNEEDENDDSDEVEILSWPTEINGMLRSSGFGATLLADGESEDELGIWEQDDSIMFKSIDNLPVGYVEKESAREARTPTPEPYTPVLKPYSHVHTTKSVLASERSHAADRPTKSPTKPKPPQTPSRRVTTPRQLQTPPRSSSFGPEPSNRKAEQTYSRKKPQQTQTKVIHKKAETSSSVHSNVEVDLKTKRTIETPKKQSRQGSIKSKMPPRQAPVSDSTTEDSDFEEPPKSLKAKGKERAMDDTLSYEVQTPRRKTAINTPLLSQSSRIETPKRLASNKKRKRLSSPMEIDSDDQKKTEHVSVTRSPSSSRTVSRGMSSRRGSGKNSSRRVGAEAGKSPTNCRRVSQSRSPPRALNEASPSPVSSPLLPPSTNQFSFSPWQNIQPNPPSATLPQRESSVALPNLQDPNAQYHLAQALQSLSFLMGGSLSYSPQSNSERRLYDTPAHVPVQHSWLPATPQHRRRDEVFETPRSEAAAPPTSSPVGSDYSESLPSSPVRSSIRSRGRAQSQSHNSRTSPPRSAMRSISRSRSSRYLSRHVSFSSPEATHIEDFAFEEDYSELRSDREESDIDSPTHHGRELTPGRSLSGKRRDEVKRDTPAPNSHHSPSSPKKHTVEYYESAYDYSESRGRSYRSRESEEKGRGSSQARTKLAKGGKEYR